MIRIMQTYIVILAVALLNPGAGAGIRNENFTDYAGIDPIRTTADWNIFDRQLTIPSTPHFAPSEIVDTTALATGGFALLYHRRLVDTYSLELQLYDGFGNMLRDSPRLITDSANNLRAAAVAASGTDLVVLWIESSPDAGVYAQRIDGSGDFLWPDPIRVSQDIPGVNYDDVDVAGDASGNCVVVWADDRDGGLYSVYAQKLDAAGMRLWNPADVRVHPAGTLTEYDPAIALDAAGRSFIAWSESSDILMNRLSPAGAPAWTNGAPVTMDATDNQFDPAIIVREGFGVMISYSEFDGTNESLEIIARDFDGNPLWPADTVVKAVAGRMDNHGLVPTDSGVICAMASSYEGDWTAYTRPVNLDGSLPTADIEPIVVPGVTWYSLEGVSLIDTADQGPLILVRNGTVTLFITTYLSGISDQGIPNWGGFVNLADFPGPINPAFGRFIENSGGGDGSFGMLWTDSRNGPPGVFARDLSGTLIPIGDRDAPVSDSVFSYTAAAEATDGDRVFYRMDRIPGEDRLAVVARRFDGDGVPVWGDWQTVSDPLADPSPSEICAVNDALGRTAAAWVDFRSSAVSVYYQIMDAGGSRILPTDLRLNIGDPGDIYDVSMASFGDGTVAVAWRDNHDDGFHVYYTRITTDGTILYNPPIRVDNIPGVQVASVSITEYVGFIYAAFVTAETDSQTVYAYLIAGDSVAEEFLIAGPYIEAGDVRTVVMEPAGLIVAWSASDGVATNIWAQRIAGGLPEWGPARVNAGGAAAMTITDLISPGPQQVTAMFVQQNVPGLIEYRLQSLNLAGTRQFTQDKPLVDPLPAVRDTADAVSVPLNGGEPVTWATISHARADLNGGFISWYLSGDGGMTWTGTVPGAVVTFDPPATDLRWGATLQAEPAQTVSPAVEDLAVVWGGTSPYLTTELSLSGNVFEAGDPFELDLHLAGSGGVTADIFVILDVYGMYWFWPGWTETADFVTDTPAAGVTSINLFNFTWPAVSGSAAGLYFWAGAVASGSAELTGDIDWVEFGYQ